MKMITIPQPWASLVALGMKTILTRPDPTPYIGPVTIWSAETAPSIEDAYIRGVLSRPGIQWTPCPWVLNWQGLIWWIVEKSGMPTSRVTRSMLLVILRKGGTRGIWLT